MYLKQKCLYCTFQEASKCLNQPSEVKDEVNCEKEESPDVSTNVTEKTGDDEAAAIIDSESVEKGKQTEDAVSGMCFFNKFPTHFWNWGELTP